MKISVLVPVYGVEKYIARCAESLFGQTYNDLEFVFVDDCTPDRSIAVLHEVMERWPQRAAQVRILRNDRNSGVGYVRQRLIDESTGDCLTLLTVTTICRRGLSSFWRKKWSVRVPILLTGRGRV